MKKVLFCLMGVLLLTACEKKETDSSLLKTTPSSKTTSWSDLCDIPNTANKYDSAGMEHNRLMEKCEKHAVRYPALGVYEVTDKIIHAEYRGRIGSSYSSERFAKPVLDSLRDSISLRNYVNSLSTSSLQKAKLNQLLTIMLKYDGTNLCDIISEIKTFENALIKAYRSIDIEIVLIASSVARYSLAYWHTRVSGSDRSFGKTTWSWKKFWTGVADAVGAAGGAAVGGATVVGGITGGIVGAIGASAGFAELWDVFGAP